YSDTCYPRSNSRYKESYHVISLSIHKSVFIYPGIANVGGLVTVYAEKFAPRCYRACWVVGGYRAKYGLECGYIIKGFHVLDEQVKAVTSETGKRALAIRIVNERRKQAVSIAKNRLSCLRFDRQRKFDFSRKACKVWVTFESSLKAGNCETGTRAMKNIILR